MKIEPFVPPPFSRTPFSDDVLPAGVPGGWRYASSGKAALRHLCRSHRLEGDVLVPVYGCTSILVPLRKLGLPQRFYDVDAADLNPDVDSVRREIERQRPAAVIGVSLYGLPADNTALEMLCRESGVPFIDDAAQSFGATVDGRAIGTFGDGGLYSFAPGKATAAHMGSFYWSRVHDERPQTRHDMLHYLRWTFFRLNRLGAYRWRWIHPLSRGLEWVFNYIAYQIDIDDDRMAPFESDVLGGVLHEVRTRLISARRDLSSQFLERFGSSDTFRVVASQRGESSPHKFVVVFDTPERASACRDALAARSVASAFGYRPLARDLGRLPTMNALDGRILELPMEVDASRMEILFGAFEQAVG